MVALLTCFNIASVQVVPNDRDHLPNQFRLSWSDDPKTTMTVIWQMVSPAAEALVEFGLTNPSEKGVAARRVRYLYDTGSIYEATLQGLLPDTRYFYRVVTRSSDGKVYLSPVASFRTAPDGPKDFTFVAVGDHGTTEISRKNIERMVKEAPAFWLVLGDLSYANGRQPVWDEWFTLIEPLTRQIPMMTTIGNHENEGKELNDEANRYSPYLARLALPQPETWYAFDYAEVRFVAFNSDDYRNEEQLTWFERTLRQARQDPSVRWLIVFLHHPLYSSTVRRLNNQGLIDTIGNLLDEHKVDLVLAGHNHNYERTYPLRGMEPNDRYPNRYQQGEGVVYVTAGGGGKSLYDFTPEVPPFTACRQKIYHYLRVKVTTTTLTVEAIRTDDGATIDRFAIVAKNQ